MPFRSSDGCRSGGWFRRDPCRSLTVAGLLRLSLFFSHDDQFFSDGCHLGHLGRTGVLQCGQPGGHCFNLAVDLVEFFAHLFVVALERDAELGRDCGFDRAEGGSGGRGHGCLDAGFRGCKEVVDDRSRDRCTGAFRGACQVVKWLGFSLFLNGLCEAVEAGHCVHAVSQRMQRMSRVAAPRSGADLDWRRRRPGGRRFECGCTVMKERVSRKRTKRVLWIAVPKWAISSKIMA